VLGLAETGDLTDAHVVGRVGEYHLRQLAIEQAGIGCGLACIRAQNAVLAKEPQITKLGDGRCALIEIRHSVGRIDLWGRRATISNDLDFGRLEARDLGKIDVDFGQEGKGRPV